MSSLRQIIRLKIPQVLNELRVVFISSTPQDDGYGVFAYKGYLFLYDEFDPPWEEMEKESGLALSDVKEDVEEEGTSTDWFVGYVREGWLYPSTNPQFQHHPVTSRLMRHIVRELGLEGGSHSEFDVDTEESEEEEEIPAYAMQERLPDVLYHGTSSDSLFGPGGILRVGLRPGGQIGKTRWGEQDIIHSEAVFLGTFVETKFHASKAAKEQDGFPVILGIRIPDKERVVADYDVDIQSGATTYPKVRQASYEERKRKWGGPIPQTTGRVGRGPLKTSIDVMRIGYLGRIPAKFVVEFYYYSEAYSSWERTDIEDLEKMQQMYDEYGSDYYEMDPSEFEEEEDEY